MDVFEADYSNLFAAGLRGIQSRSTDPDRSSSKSQLQPAIGSDQGVERVEGPNVPSSVWKSFLPSTRSWRRPPRLPQSVKTPSVVRNLTSWSGFVSKSARRDSIPSNILEESSLKLRILDWSLHVSNAVDTLGEDDEDDECVDHYSFEEVDPIDVPASTPRKILFTMPTSASLGEREISPALEQHGYRMSLPALPMHMMMPPRHYRSFFSSDDEETTWDSASASSSEDESGRDDDLDQFRVEWIDFDGAH